MIAPAETITLGDGNFIPLATDHNIVGGAQCHSISGESRLPASSAPRQ